MTATWIISLPHEAPCWNHSFSECLDERIVIVIVTLIVFLSELPVCICRWQIVIQRQAYHSINEPADGHCPSLSMLNIITSYQCIAHRNAENKSKVLIMKGEMFKNTQTTICKNAGTLRGVTVRPLTKQHKQLNLAYKHPLRQEESVWKTKHNLFCSH